MTALSVNLNKLALLRNSRGRNYPNLLHFAQRYIDMGVQGITIHPRPDERHIKQSDALELARFLQNFPHVEFNIEGYPSEAFMQLVATCNPEQCTLVPDADNQLTSDHGWDCFGNENFLRPILERLKAMGVRSALFLDPELDQVEQAANIGAERIELYTEAYAVAFVGDECKAVTQRYRAAAEKAQQVGLGVNAGHDLDLLNLPNFLSIPGILEVSIGHALMVESIEQGMNTVIERYLDICQHGAEL